MKNAIVAVAIFILLLAPAASSSSLVFEETEKISLNVSTYDPDNDNLRITFTGPVNEQGEWQTAYGDAGVYPVTITVTDGELSTTEQVSIVIVRKEEQPHITSSSPPLSDFEVKEGKEISFSIKATDQNLDALSYLWTLDGKSISEGDSFTYSPSYKEAGSHTLAAHVSDGSLTTVKEWNLNVVDVDLDTLIMDRVPDITVTEGDVVRLTLPDFGYYSLQHSISEPLGNDNYWKTNSESAGEYTVVVNVSGNGFKKSKKVSVEVLDNDHAPVLSGIPSQIAYEGKQLSIPFSAIDEDGDHISYSLSQAPEGMFIDGSSVVWTPSYDVVEPQGIIARILRSFHALNTVVPITLVAEANGAQDSVTFPITVFNVNRPPMISAPSSVMLKEGDVLSLPVNITDPDNDKVSVSYGSDLQVGKQIPFDAQGTHAVAVRASDGFLDSTFLITVHVDDTNRAPSVKQVSSKKVKEGESVTFTLSADDPDNDPVSFALSSGEEGATIAARLFTWTPSFNQTSMERESFPFTASASDGNLFTDMAFSIEVINVNRAPELTGPPVVRATVKKNVPVTLIMDAVDPDQDKLTATWRFGFMDSYKGGSTVKRVFSTPGIKEITVASSDGKASVEKTFIITVV